MSLSGQSYWDEQAESFDEEADHGLRDRDVRAAWRAVLLGHLPAPPADIADLGCGTGSLAVLLAECGYAVEGVDFSGRMVAAATAKASAAAVSVTFRQGDASAPPLESASYDVVLARHVLWALPDPSEALRRWFELLRPGGRLVLVEGRWSTGAGIPAEECARLVRRQCSTVTLHPLSDERLWGRRIEDERYLVAAAL
jgi:ubiquinone/menaquinone biosynthesis C-methylase UbiE